MDNVVLLSNEPFLRKFYLRLFLLLLLIGLLSFIVIRPIAIDICVTNAAHIVYVAIVV